VGAEAGAEGDEPEIAGAVGRGFAEGAIEGEEDGGAAHVAVVAESFATGLERMWSDDRFEGVEDIAPAGVRDDARDGARAASGPKFTDGGGGKFGDGTVEEVAEFAVTLLEAEFVALGGDVKRVEIEGAESVRIVGWLCAPDGTGGAVGEEAGADEDAGIVVEVESRRADFDGDAGDGGVGVCRENVAGAAEEGNGSAATETDEILEEGVGAEAEMFGDVAGETGAEVAGAGADEERVEVGWAEAELFEGGRERAGGERGGFGAEAGVELVGGEIEDVCEIGGGEVAFGDAVVALEDGAEDELRFTTEPVAHGRKLGE